MKTLCSNGFNSVDTATSQEALRCLANALLLEQETRQIFVDLGFAEKAADKLKVRSHSRAKLGVDGFNATGNFLLIPYAI